MASKVFIDTNVFLDVLMHRGADWHYAESLLLLAEQRRITAHTSASNLLNLIYVLGSEKRPRAEIIGHATGMLRLSRLVNPDNTVFEMALNSAFSDLEDAVQYFTALSIPGMDCFITSNTKDFKKATPTLPVCTPRDFMRLLQTGE